MGDVFKGSRQHTWEWGLRLSFWPHMCMHIPIHMHTCTSYYTFLWQIIHVFIIVSPYEKKQTNIYLNWIQRFNLFNWSLWLAVKSTEEKEVEIIGTINCDQLNIAVVCLERWLSREGQELLLQRTPVQFPEPMSDTSRLPLIPARGRGGGWGGWSGSLFWCLRPPTLTAYTHTETQN